MLMQSLKLNNVHELKHAVIMGIANIEYNGSPFRAMLENIIGKK